MSDTTNLIREMTRDYDQLQNNLQVALRVIASLVAKDKKISAATFDKTANSQVQITGEEDGSVTVSVTRGALA